MPVLLLLFVGSGAAALIYEIVWLQLLQLVIGSSAVSVGVLLGTFMGGMCLGTLLLPRVVSTDRHPLRVYAALELGIGAFGLILLIVMPLVGDRAILGWLANQPPYAAADTRYAEAARSGDLGFTWGTYIIPGRGRAPREEGFYARVWVRERNGQWKIAADITQPQ